MHVLNLITVFSHFSYHTFITQIAYILILNFNPIFCGIALAHVYHWKTNALLALFDRFNFLFLHIKNKSVMLLCTLLLQVIMLLCTLLLSHVPDPDTQIH